jgi:hypothetical protein
LWTRPGARLAVLLLVLATLLSYATVTRIASSDEDDPVPAASRAPCPPRAPQPLKVGSARLAAIVKASGIGRLTGSRTPDEEGAQVVEAAWKDGSPSHGSGAASAPSMVSAGYEIRWSSPAGDILVADVFAFPTRADARRFVALAATTRCRSGARVYPASSPPGALGLVWPNPLLALQWDLFFARGSHAYRVTVVPLPPGGDDRRIDFARVLRLLPRVACGLREAHCVPAR